MRDVSHTDERTGLYFGNGICGRYDFSPRRFSGCEFESYPRRFRDRAVYRAAVYRDHSDRPVRRQAAQFGDAMALLPEYDRCRSVGNIRIPYSAATGSAQSRQLPAPDALSQMPQQARSRKSELNMPTARSEPMIVARKKPDETFRIRLGLGHSG